MEYLTVKDVATLVRRNEETIRRMIRARKLDVTLDNNNRKQGYMISVDQLTRTWDISRDEVEAYIARRQAESESQPAARQPLGPERADDPAPENDVQADERAGAGDDKIEAVKQWGAAISDSVAKALAESARRISYELNRAAGRVDEMRAQTGDDGQRAAGEAPRAAENADGKTACGGVEDMNGNDGWNKWVNSDTHGSGNGEWNDAQSGSTTNHNVNENYNGNPQGAPYSDFSADFSAAGEKVSEIIGDAYRQIRRAVEQAGAAYSTNREQNGDAARRAGNAHVYSENQNANAAERAAESARTNARNNASAADMARQAYEQRQATIRDAIIRSSGAQTAQTAQPEQQAPRATGGWAESIRSARTTETAAQQETHSVTVEEKVQLNKTVTVQPEAVEEPAVQPEVQPKPAAPEKPAMPWDGVKPSTAPEFERFKGRQPDFGEADVPRVSPHGVDAPEDNVSYQMLQAARKAVEERIRAARAAEQNAAESAAVETTEQPEEINEPAQPEAAIEPAPQEVDVFAGEAKEVPAPQAEEPAASDAAPESADEAKVTAAESAARAIADNIIRLSAAVDAEPAAGDDEMSAAACGHASDENAAPEDAAQPEDIAAEEPAQPEEQPETVAQIPAEDDDAMQNRIDSLESQLSKLSSQLELLTKKLLGGDDK